MIIDEKTNSALTETVATENKKKSFGSHSQPL
jgi:hypothetical protein